MTGWKKGSSKNRILFFLLSGCLIFQACFLAVPQTCQAQTQRTLTLSQAKSLAVANSEDYEKTESELAVKQASLSQAYRTIREKKKNMSTFRWSPLLSFKFPTSPDLAEAYEFEFKPIEIQSEIDSLNHKLTDIKLAEYETVSSLYVDVVILEQTIAFNEERLENFQSQLVKDRAKLRYGQATQNDIDVLQANITSLTDQIAGDRRSLSQNKSKLSDAVGMDVSTGYTFEDPMITADISREKLEELTQYTLDHDQTYYEACMTEQTSLTSLKTNYNLMNGQYGKYMNRISGYINQVYAGNKVNKKAFKSDYETFLKEIDAKWQGNIRILFIKIPKEWFKGEISGIRYVEDEPYALYEAALEYEDARLARENTEMDITDQVADSFENYISMRNAYLKAKQNALAAGESLKASATLNRLGELTNEEYTSEKEDYEGLQTDMLSALADYSKALYSLDRLTCGGVSLLMDHQDADLTAGDEGNSYVRAEYEDGPYYYIESIIEQEQFRLSVYVPEDCGVTVTDYELWCDGEQIGERTATDKSIRHLALSRESVERAFLRFYNGDTFVDDCEIDPAAAGGKLTFVTDYTPIAQETELGEYTYSANAKTGMVTLGFSLYEDVSYYRILASDGKYLNSGKYYGTDQEFQYLNLLKDSLAELKIELYDENRSELYEGYFDTADNKLMENRRE